MQKLNGKRRFPDWLRKKLNWQDTKEIKSFLRKLDLHTVCEAARCPNISECFGNNQATFMILGDICTRGCKFCAVKRGSPLPPDENEPQRVAKAVGSLRLKYVVVTSVTRDDLPDYGADHFYRTIKHIRNLNQAKVEVLTPDFQGSLTSIKRVIEARPDVFNHNLETVPRLYSLLRPDASYMRSLNILRVVKELDDSVCTKSGLMLGLGECEDELIQVMRDLRGVGCDILTLGQYLQPSFSHCSVVEYLKPQEFDRYRKIAEEMGFSFVASGPYIRSSYMAEEAYLCALS